MKDSIKFFDKITFFILLAISIIGIFLIYSASYTETSIFFYKQLIWLTFSIAVFFFVFRIRTELVFRYGVFFYISIVILLLLQLISGKIIAGTKSWVKFGFFSVQISEFMKIALAIVIAKYITKVEKIKWKEFLMLGLIIGIPFVLIALQPDMGTA